MRKLIYLWFILCCLLLTIIVLGLLQIHRRGGLEDLAPLDMRAARGDASQRLKVARESLIIYLTPLEELELRHGLGGQGLDSKQFRSHQGAVKLQESSGGGFTTRSFGREGGGLSSALARTIDLPVRIIFCAGGEARGHCRQMAKFTATAEGVNIVTLPGTRLRMGGGKRQGPLV